MRRFLNARLPSGVQCIDVTLPVSHGMRSACVHVRNLSRITVVENFALQPHRCGSNSFPAYAETGITRRSLSSTAACETGTKSNKESKKNTRSESAVSSVVSNNREAPRAIKETQQRGDPEGGKKLTRREIVANLASRLSKGDLLKVRTTSDDRIYVSCF